jgi:hypothetical protein
MGIEEDFYCTLKLKTGEEIFAKVAATEEEDRTLILVSNPIILTQVKSRNNTVGYKLEPWLKTTTEDLFIINIEDVITMSESSDIEMIMMYQSYVRQSNREKTNQPKLNRRMGYISNVHDAKDILEKIYKSS